MASHREEKKLKLCAELCVGRGFGLALTLVGTREDAEDIVQEALLIATRKVGALPRRPWPWLATTIAHLARNRWRKAQRRGPTLPLRDYEAATQATPLADAVRAEMREQLREALAGLAPAERDAIALVHVAGLSQRQAARQQGQPFTSFQRDLASALAKVEAKINLPSKTLLAALPALALEVPSSTFAASISSTGVPSLAATASISGAGITTLTIGGIVMKKSLVIVSLLLLLLGGTAMIVFMPGEEPVSPLTTSSRDRVDPETERKAPVDTPTQAAPIVEEQATPEVTKQAINVAIEAGPQPLAQEDKAPEPAEPLPTRTLIVLNEDGTPATGLFVSWDGPRGPGRSKSPNWDGRIDFSESDGIDEASVFIIERPGYDKESFKREAVETQTIILKKGEPTITFNFKIIQTNGHAFPNGHVTIYHKPNAIGPYVQLGGAIDAAGFVAIELRSKVSSGDSFSAIFSLSSHGTEALARRELSAQEAAPNVVVMEASAPLLVRGRLVDERAGPLPEIDINSAAFFGLPNEAKKWSSSASARSGLGGHFLLALPKTRRLRLTRNYAGYSSDTKSTKHYRLDQIFEIPAEVTTHDLGDVVPLEVANLRLTLTQDGEPVSGVKLEFMLGGELIATSSTDQEGLANYAEISMKAIRESSAPLMVRATLWSVLVDWTDINEAALQDQLIELIVKSSPVGKLQITLNPEDDLDSKLGIDLHCWQRTPAGDDVGFQIPFPKRANIANERALAIGNYYGFITERGFSGRRASKVFEFVIVEGITTTVTPDCLTRGICALEFYPAYQHRTTFTLRYDSTRLNLPELSAGRYMTDGIYHLFVFSDEPAQLIITVSDEAGECSQSRSIKIPPVAAGETTRLKVKDEIEALLKELGE